MNTITRKYYGREDFKTVIIPSWQRWRNENNVKDLAEAVMEQGQLRPVLICVLPDETKILTDGAHLFSAMHNYLNLRKIAVFEKYVESEEEARRTFISFNTRGKSLHPVDYVVSYAGSGNKQYKKFLKDVLLSPKNRKEADLAHGKLFTVTSLMKLFLGNNDKIRKGTSVLPKWHERLVEIVEYLGCNYLLNGKLLAHTNKNGSNMRLNGTTVEAVLSVMIKNNMIAGKSNEQIMNELIEFTTYHYNSMESPAYTRDAVVPSFKLLHNIKD
tara:strand:- start:875 stop:1687 length:813 start_codon:yes stop_codon:yes gene_type:complete